MNSSADRRERAVILRREVLTNACERETAEANINEKTHVHILILVHSLSLG